MYRQRSVLGGNYHLAETILHKESGKAIKETARGNGWSVITVSFFELKGHFTTSVLSDLK